MRLWLIFFLYTTSLFAIIDIASVDFGDKEKGFSGAAYGSFQKSRGNTDKDETEYGGRIQYDTNKTITWLQGAVEDDKVNGQANADNIFVHLRHIRQTSTPSWAMEFYGQLRQDEFKSLKNRTLFGAGPRYKIADSKSYGKLFAGLSVMDERIRYTDNTINPDEHNYRASSYLSYQITINDNLEFSYLGYYQPKLDNGSDYMIASTAELIMHLTEVFDMSYLIEFDYDAQPAYDVAQTDIRQKLSFVYRFGEKDPLSSYASTIINYIDSADESIDNPIHTNEENSTRQSEASVRTTLAGAWRYGDEVFSLLANGKGSYLQGDGIYEERVSWSFLSSDPVSDDNSGRVISISFQDEEGRPGRTENYLWNENTLVGLSGERVKPFKR